VPHKCDSTSEIGRGGVYYPNRKNSVRRHCAERLALTVGLKADVLAAIQLYVQRAARTVL